MSQNSIDLEALVRVTEAQRQLREGSGGQGPIWAVSNAPVRTDTLKQAREMTRRYEAGLELPAEEWAEMIFAEAQAWRSRPRPVAD